MVHHDIALLNIPRSVVCLAVDIIAQSNRLPRALRRTRDVKFVRLLAQTRQFV